MRGVHPVQPLADGPPRRRVRLHHARDDGLAILRADLANNAGITADAFRKYLLVPVSAPLQRRDVDVRLAEDNCRLDYTVVDVENSYGTGDTGVSKVEVSATAGSELAASSTLGGVGVMAGFIPGLLGSMLFGAKAGGWFGAASGASGAAGAGLSITPRGLANCCVRVWGKKGTSKRYLAGKAVDVACDRLTGSWNNGDIAFHSAYVTLASSSSDPPMVEFRASLYLKNMSLQWILDGAATVGALNFENYLTTNGLNWTNDTPRPSFGTSSNTRGDWRQQMAYQALTGPCGLPNFPVDAQLPFKPDADGYK